MYKLNANTLILKNNYTYFEQKNLMTIIIFNSLYKNWKYTKFSLKIFQKKVIIANIIDCLLRKKNAQ